MRSSIGTTKIHPFLVILARECLDSGDLERACQRLRQKEVIAARSCIHNIHTLPQLQAPPTTEL
jgi:hypothetical protein